MEFFHHSTYYHDYWKDYSELQTENNGKKKIQRIYIGDYYVFSKGRTEWKIHKFICTFLFGTQFLSFFFGVLLDTPGNHSFFVVLPELCTALLQLILFLTCFLFLTAPYKMTIYQYHTTVRRIILLSRCCIIIEGLIIGITILTWLFSSSKEISYEQCLSVILLITALFLTVLLQKLVSGATYSVEKNDTAVQDGGNKIC